MSNADVVSPADMGVMNFSDMMAVIENPPAGI